MFNPHDNPAFERSVANPTRGVGAKTLAKIRSLANKHNISYIQASSKMIDENLISGRGANGLKKFLEIILGLCGKIDDISLSEIVGSILEQSGLIQFHEKEPGEKGKTRKENLEELLSAAKNFEMSFSDDKTNREITEQFLSNVSLDAGDRQADEFDDE